MTKKQSGLQGLAAGYQPYAPTFMPDQGNWSDRLNTQLTPEQEAAFQAYVLTTPRGRPDTWDYDHRGQWLAMTQGLTQLAPNGHGSDQWKKPNHPTFSDQSMYHGPGFVGGQWGNNTYTPSDTNLRNRSLADLMGYFSEREPDVRLLPMKTRGK